MRHPCLSALSLVMIKACMSASDAVHPVVPKFIIVIRLKWGEAGTSRPGPCFLQTFLVKERISGCRCHPRKRPKGACTYSNDGLTLLLFVWSPRRNIKLRSCLHNDQACNWRAFLMHSSVHSISAQTILKHQSTEEKSPLWKAQCSVVLFIFSYISSVWDTSIQFGLVGCNQINIRKVSRIPAAPAFYALFVFSAEFLNT